MVGVADGEAEVPVGGEEGGVGGEGEVGEGEGVDSELGEAGAEGEPCDEGYDAGDDEGGEEDGD